MYFRDRVTYFFRKTRFLYFGMIQMQDLFQWQCVNFADINIKIHI